MDAVTICNQALGKCESEATVTALNDTDSDDTEEARHCSIWYEQDRDFLLRTHDWNFASTFVSLAKIGTAPGLWTFQYQYPVNCMNAREIVKTVATDPDIPFNVIIDEGSDVKYIVTDTDDADLRFTRKVTDPDMFDPTFTDLLSTLIATHVAGPLTGSEFIITKVNNMLRETSVGIMGIDAREQEAEEETVASWITDRE